MDTLLRILYMTVEMFNYILLFYVVFGVTATKKVWKYILFFIGIIGIQLFDFSHTTTYDTEIFAVLGWILTIFLLNGPKLKNSILYISVFILSSICSIIFFYSLCLLKNRPVEVAIYSTGYSLLSNSAATVCILIFMIYYKMRKHTQPLITLSSMFQYIWLGISLFLCDGILGGMQLLAFYTDIDKKIINIFSLFFSIVLFSFFLLLVFLSKSVQEKNHHQHQEELAKLRIKEQEERFTLMNQSDTAMRRFRHDIKNHLVILHELLLNKKYEDATHYLEKLGTTFNDTIQTTYTGIIVVDAIINHYKQEMLEHSIEFKWENSMITNTDAIEIFDICTIFDNLLSNAVEACIKLNTKSTIRLCVEIHNNHWMILESNPLAAPLHFDADNNPITTKKDTANHGFGSKNIREIVNKYHGTLDYNQTDKQFEIQLMI